MNSMGILDEIDGGRKSALFAKIALFTEISTFYGKVMKSATFSKKVLF